VGKELTYIANAHACGQLAGNGIYTKKCQEWIEQNTGSSKVLLTHSCTAALEMAAILADIQPSDEVIMPSYTFVSTANAFVLRGGIPVFVDIRSDTLNIDESKIEAAITSKTKAIVAVHYAGVACEMDTIMTIAKKHNLMVIEDAAQGVLSTYKGRKLGSIGNLGCYSFHETKNIISGEGGALLVNDKTLVDRAEILWEKGTNRNLFFRGEVDKYTWVDKGSSYLPGEITAAFLFAQLEESKAITERRIAIWNRYHLDLQNLDEEGFIRRPFLLAGTEHNAHMYQILLPNLSKRTAFIKAMKDLGVGCVFHYVPLHNSPYGLKSSRTHGELSVTTMVADRLVRLPMWLGLEPHQREIINLISNYFYD